MLKNYFVISYNVDTQTPFMDSMGGTSGVAVAEAFASIKENIPLHVVAVLTADNLRAMADYLENGKTWPIDVTWDFSKTYLVQG